MKHEISAKTALELEFATRVMAYANAGHDLTNGVYTAHAHAAADHVVQLFIQQGRCDESPTTLALEFKLHIAGIFTRAVTGAGKLSGITPEASHLLIDLDPHHAYHVALAIGAIVGAGFADSSPDIVNNYVDNAPRPDEVAGTIGQQRQMVAQMNA